MSSPQVSRTPEPPALDETVWQAWLDRNRREERLYFAKRLKIGILVSPLVLAGLRFWLLKIS